MSSFDLIDNDYMAVAQSNRQTPPRQGLTVLYAVVILVALTGFASLGVDWGRVQLVKTELQQAADAAGRAACAGLLTDVASARSMAVT